MHRMWWPGAGVSFVMRRRVAWLPSLERLCTRYISQRVNLRPYQQECVDACLQALQRGCTRMGVSSPTGSGKTTIFTELISRINPENDLGTQALVLVNGVTLAQQAAERARHMFPHWCVEIEQGSKHVATGNADVTVAMVQTLRKPERLVKFDPRRFKCVIIDEAHHATSSSYLNILSHFHCDIQSTQKELLTEQSCTVPIIGFSATFARHDGVSLGQVFQEIVFHKDFLDMIDEQWYVFQTYSARLCPIRFTLIRADMNLSDVASTASDYVVSSLAKVVNQPDITTLVVRSWLDLAWKDRKATLVFAVDIDHIRAVVSEFQARGIDARAIHSGMSQRERKQVLTAFHAGEFPVLVNCGL